MQYAVFQQRHYYYKFNLQSITIPYWLGSRICVKKYLKSPQWLRELKFKKRPWWRYDKKKLNNIIEDGGWHFCNLKKPIDLLFKYKNLCETNDPYVFNEKIDPKHLNELEIIKKIEHGIDIIGRNHKYEKSKIDKSYPSYFLNNLDKYKDWVV